ncbi:MAG: AraC family transcriptional regulator [Pseudomonadota bacterium]
MSPEETLVFGLRLAVITISCLAGIVYLLQWRLSPVYAASSSMFLAFGSSQIVYVVEAVWPGVSPFLHHSLHMLSYSAAFFLLPTFFFHLKLLSGTPEPITKPQMAVHLALPMLVLSFAAISLFIPIETVTALKNEVPGTDAPIWMFLVVKTLLLMQFGGYAFVAVYIGLLFRWRGRYRGQPKSIFASGEQYELFWTIGLAAVMAGFIVNAMLAYFVRGEGLGNPLGPVEQAVIVLLFIFLVAVRGLLQAPGLFGGYQRIGTDTGQSGPKYSKSALAKEHAERIARKLKHAMMDDGLYRDANLSLTLLAQHIGASSNYVSQTLNEHMQNSFFDFINHWRIEDAKDMLLHGNETILTITYEVGFNSRSAFYTAFKKETGMTPSQFRKEGGLGIAAGAATENAA